MAERVYPPRDIVIALSFDLEFPVRAGQFPAAAAETGLVQILTAYLEESGSDGPAGTTETVEMYHNPETLQNAERRCFEAVLAFVEHRSLDALPADWRTTAPNHIIRWHAEEFVAGPQAWVDEFMRQVETRLAA